MPPTVPMPDQTPTDRLRPTLGLLPILAISAAVAGPAAAQTTIGTVELDTIVVEGQKGGQAANEYRTDGSVSDKVLTPLQDTPKTIKVITRKEIAERGQTSLTDILRATPGITLGTGENGQSPGVNPTIRGNNSANDVMVDGFRSGLRGEFEAFNIESVEVTKGPGGTAAGNGSTGGTVNLGSKRPLAGENFNDAALTFGTGEFKRATLDSNRSFGDLALRLNVMAQDAESLQGRKGRTSGRFGIAPSLSYSFGGSTTLTAGLYYLRNKDLNDYGVPLTTAATPAPFGRGTGTADDPFMPADVPTWAFYGNQDKDYNDATTRSAFVRIDHDFSSGLRWSTQLRWQDSHIDYYVSRPQSGATDVTQSGVGRDRYGTDIALNSQLTGEANLWGLTHRFAIGIDVSNSDVSVRTPSASGTPATLTTPYDNPDPWAPWTGSYTYGAFTDSKYSTRAIYLFDVIELSPQWEASFGLRFDKFKASSFNQGTLAAADNESSFWNGNIGVVYKPSEDISVYASVGSSANPGGEPTGQGGTANNNLDPLEPERAYSYELGTKWSLFDDRLLLSAAIYETKKDNARVTGEDGTTQNIGKTRSRGFEIDVAGQIDERWGISAGYAYTDARIVDNGFTGCPAACVPSTSNGTRVAGVPLHALSLWTTYAVNDRLTLGGGAQYVGKRTLNAAGTVAFPDHVRVDLMASYKVSEATSIRFNANNIFDEQIYTGNRGNGWANVEPGRNFTLSLTHSF